MTNNANIRLKRASRLNNVPLWLLADHCGCSESTMYRKVRRELPEEEQDRLIALIEKIAKGE